MTLITRIAPQDWRDLESSVADILRECGMAVQQQIHLSLPRGGADIDVMAEDTDHGITHRVVCECKNWRTNVPQETGANRGYIISRTGFQAGAHEAAHATNIELVTYAEFQEKYFEKWFKQRRWDIERSIGNFNVYFEPLGKPGYHLLKTKDERDAYDAIWARYLFAG